MKVRAVRADVISPAVCGPAIIVTACSYPPAFIRIIKAGGFVDRIDKSRMRGISALVACSVIARVFQPALILLVGSLIASLYHLLVAIELGLLPGHALTVLGGL